MLIVKKLKEMLDQYPDDLIICIPDGGDGGGYNPLSGDMETLKMSDFGERGSYYGRFTEYEEGRADMTYKRKNSDIEFPLFCAHFVCLLIKT
jgi:hypothetical protein